MKRYLVGLFLLVATAPAIAAPQILSQEGCYMLADVGVTSRAMVSEGVDEVTVNRILRKIYRINPEFPEWNTIIPLVVKAAMKVTEGTPGDFARLLGGTCINNRGNLDSILGDL
jgi:hypothetical protein